MYIDLLNPVFKRFGLTDKVRIHEWKPDTVVSKDTLIRGMRPRFKRGGMFFRKGYTDVLVDQLDDYPQVDNDDVLDALVQQKAIDGRLNPRS